MRHVLSILCERAIIDKETNLVSYLTAIEEVEVRSLPFRIPFLAFASLWRSEGESPASIELKLTMINPDKSAQEVFSSYKLQSTARMHRTNMILNGYEFEQSGTYALRLERRNGGGWELVTEIPFDITVVAARQDIPKKPGPSERSGRIPRKRLGG